MNAMQQRIEEIRKLAPLTDLDLAIADADAMILLARVRKDNPRGFHIITRALTRILKRVLTGNAGECYSPKRGVNADATILGLIYQLVDLQPAREVR